MEINKVKSISDSLHKYDFCIKENSDQDYIEMTQWQNGEGYNITFGEYNISLSDGMIDAILHLRNCLLYDK